jgi:hypothetical protein
MTKQFTQQFQEAADKMKQFVPEVKFNKNGYEIRTQMLEMAQNQAWQDYHAKFAGWEQSVEQDEKTGQVISKVTMPVVPGVDKVLEAAEKFYAFVNQNTAKK